MTIINEIRNLSRNASRKTIISIYFLAVADIALTILAATALTLLFI